MGLAMTKVNNIELKKMIDVFGARKVFDKHLEGKLTLVGRQVDKVLKLKDEEPRKKVVKTYMTVEELERYKKCMS